MPPYFVCLYFPSWIVIFSSPQGIFSRVVKNLSTFSLKMCVLRIRLLVDLHVWKKEQALLPFQMDSQRQRAMLSPPFLSFTFSWKLSCPHVGGCITGCCCGPAVCLRAVYIGRAYAFLWGNNEPQHFMDKLIFPLAGPGRLSWHTSSPRWSQHCWESSPFGLRLEMVHGLHWLTVETSSIILSSYSSFVITSQGAPPICKGQWCAGCHVPGRGGCYWRTWVTTVSIYLSPNENDSLNHNSLTADSTAGRAGPPALLLEGHGLSWIMVILYECKKVVMCFQCLVRRWEIDLSQLVRCSPYKHSGSELISSAPM